MEDIAKGGSFALEFNSFWNYQTILVSEGEKSE